MLDLAARAVRDRVGADIAVLNRAVLDSAWRPARPGRLTESDVYVAVEYDEPIEVTEVDAAWVARLAQAAARSRGVVVPGLTWTGEGAEPRVGGYPTESRATYRVATLRFLAMGGDGVLPELPRGSAWTVVLDTTLRSVLLEHLRVPREGDPRGSLRDPTRTTEWMFRASADLTFSGSSVANPAQRCTNDTPPEACSEGRVLGSGGTAPAAYATSALDRADTLTFGVAVDLTANAAAPDWTWQSNLNVVYRTAWVESRAGEPFSEAADQVRGRSTFAWSGLRGDRDRWYIPDPTLDLFIESELSAPGDRSWHWFLTRPTLGLRFPLLDKLELRLIGGLQFQPFDPQMEVEAGLGATLALAPWDLLALGSQHVRVALNLDYFLVDLGDQNRGQLRGQLDASFDLAGPLALVLSGRLFVQSEQGQDIGVAIDATAGLRLGHVQRASER
jgi:hypothetical protein